VVELWLDNEIDDHDGSQVAPDTVSAPEVLRERESLPFPQPAVWSTVRWSAASNDVSPTDRPQTSNATASSCGNMPVHASPFCTRSASRPCDVTGAAKARPREIRQSLTTFGVARRRRCPGPGVVAPVAVANLSEVVRTLPGMTATLIGYASCAAEKRDAAVCWFSCVTTGQA
jgi:hypothetical protein